MKLRHFFPCLLLAGMAVTVASCTEEATLAPGQGRNVTMTVNISRVGDNTRSILEEKDGDLACTWEDTDLILVVDSKGNKLGVLELKSGAGDSNATFSGVINTDATDEADINFLYLGNKTAEELNALSNPVTFDYSAQDGSLEWLYRNDFFTGTEKVKIVNNYVTLESVSLSRQISFGKFEIQLPEGVTYGGEAITVSGTGLNTKASISMTDGLATFSEPGDITITRPEDIVSTEFFLTVLPATITPTFSVTIDNKTYSCTLAQKEWEASAFVRKDNQDSTFSGVVLNMTEQTSEDDPRYEEYKNEDPRNPLHKFAKYNLTRGDNNLNVFVDKSEKYGALYQWGRYYGFIDVTSTSGFGLYTLSSTKYSQFAEALGSKKQIPNDVWDFGVYDTNDNNKYINYKYPATGPDDGYVLIAVGLNYNGSYYGGINFDYPMFYTSREHIVTDGPYYMMDGNPIQNTISLLKTPYNPPSILEEYTNSGDYWVEAFNTDDNKGGENWTDRSDAQGFTEDKANPCPAGWRLPTSEEMQEIIPKDGLYKKNGNLATMLKNYSELRTSKNGYKYAIRWNYSNANSYIEIEAVVVDDTYTDVSQLTSEFWTSHSNTKVVRQFPFTGGIRPFTGQVYGKYTYDTIICRPMSMGKPNFIDKGDLPYVGLVSPNESISINQYFGGYWVNEKGMAMKFCAKNYEREVDGTVQETESEYTRIQMEETGPAFGMAIRPVMDK